MGRNFMKCCFKILAKTLLYISFMHIMCLDLAVYRLTGMMSLAFNTFIAVAPRRGYSILMIFGMLFNIPANEYWSTKISDSIVLRARPIGTLKHEGDNCNCNLFLRIYEFYFAFNLFSL